MKLRQATKILAKVAKRDGGHRMTTRDESRDLLRRCLQCRLPRELRGHVETFLARPPGRPRKADPVRIAAMRAAGKTTAEIAAELGCHPTAVLRVVT